MSSLAVTALAVVALALLLATLARLLTRRVRALEARTGIRTTTDVLASDTYADVAEIAHLWDPGTGLHAKPDYVVWESTPAGRGLVPIELKPTCRTRQPYESDVLELVVQMLVLRAHYGARFSGYGRLRYQDTAFVIPLDAAHTTRALAARDRARAAMALGAGHPTGTPRSHDEPRRCGRCAVRAGCSQALA